MKHSLFFIIFCAKVLMGMGKPSFIFSSAESFDMGGLRSYSRFASYPVYILVNKNGLWKGCVLTGTSEVDEIDGNDESDAREADENDASEVDESDASEVYECGEVDEGDASEDDPSEDDATEGDASEGDASEGNASENDASEGDSSEGGATDIDESDVTKFDEDVATKIDEGHDNDKAHGVDNVLSIDSQNKNEVIKGAAPDFHLNEPKIM